MPFLIPPIAGASTTNRITFLGDTLNPTAVTLQYTATGSDDNKVIQIDGADFITIRGLRLIALGTDYATCIQITGGADNVTIADNRLFGMSNAGYYDRRSLIFASGSLGANRIFTRNWFELGSFGIYYNTNVSGDPLATGTEVTDNSFSNQDRRGIYLVDQSAPVVSNNNINANSDDYNYHGISLEYCDNDVRIDRNSVIIKKGYGIYQYYCDGTISYPGLVANNLVTIGDGTANYARGIYIYYTTFQNIYHNTVEISNTGISYYRTGLYVGSGSGNIYTQNNIFSNTGFNNTGGGYAYYITAGTFIGTSDYNDLYTTGGTLAYWGADQSTLAELQTNSGKEDSSISADPQFDNAANDDYHLGEDSPAIGAGTATGISTADDQDLEGNFRPNPAGSDPDLGAYESPSSYPGEDTTPPEAPTGLVATPYSGRVDLSWEASPAPDIQFYTVFRGLTSDPNDAVWMVDIYAPATSYSDGDLTNSITYFYWLTATDNSSNESPKTSSVSATPNMFIDKGAGFQAVGQSAVAWGDYDMDGDLDVLITGYDRNNGSLRIVYQYNQTSGSYDFRGTYGFPDLWSRPSAEWGDFDGDGDLDLLLAGLSGTFTDQVPVTEIYRYDHLSDSFSPVNAGLLALYSGDVEWGDFDNDGDLDILMAGRQASFAPATRIYRNDDGVFADIGTWPTGVRDGAVSWVDIEADGDLDIVISGENSSGVLVTETYENVDGDFTLVSYSFEGVMDASHNWGDYDNDGDLDLLLQGKNGSGDPVTQIYRNDVSTYGDFVSVSAGLTAVNQGDAAWGDFDSDGDLDIAVTGAVTWDQFSTTVYRNDGGDVFTRIDDGLDKLANGNIAWGDADNDGDLDMLLTGENSEIPATGFSLLYENKLDIANSKPSTGDDQGQITVVSGNAVQLTWEKGTDSETPQDGLTYNLRIGTSPGGDEIMPSHADPATGYRRLAARGNVSHDTSWTVTGLPDGTYYWSVQVIDAGFLGSAFSAEQTFVIDIAPANPSGLTATAGDRKVDLSWTANTEADLAKYRIYRGDASPAATLIDSVIGDPPENTYMDYDVTIQPYYYRITAVDAAGNESDFSNEDNATPFITPLQQADSLALVALYNSTNGANWSEPWYLNESAENWAGVIISGGRVIELDLPDRNLIGTIPTAIGDLTALTFLDLSGNQLSGYIPAEIGGLTALGSLDLSWNTLSGNIPTEIAGITGLYYLRLRGNQLTGSIPTQLGTLTSLYYLNLSDNQLEGSIPAAIGNLINLQVLSLRGNQLTGSIPTAIGSLDSLRRLDLSRNQLDGNLPTGIGSLTKLQYIDLSLNSFTGTIPSAIGSLDSLLHLDLSRNALDGGIPPELGNLASLEYLALHRNALTGSIPSGMWNLSNLAVLYLGFNELSGQLPSEIGNLSNLSDLYLRNNQFDGPLPTQIGDLPGLVFLDLCGNNFNGTIPNEIGYLVNLQTLYLDANPFSDVLPAGITNLTNLRTLGVNSYQLPVNDPGWVSNLDSLKTLHLNGRLQVFTIPDWIGNLTQLTTFGLWDNQLPSGIPSWVANFIDLKVLWINGSQIDDSLPAWIGNLAKLEYLSIRFNQLSGAVPSEIANLGNLQALYLHDNQLDDLPDLGALSSLTHLQVQNNRFTFEDIEPNMFVASEEFIYAPQDSVGTAQELVVNPGDRAVLTVSVGGGESNQYQWIKDGTPMSEADSLVISSMSAADVGSYVLRITNTVATELTLYSRPIQVLLPAPVVSVQLPSVVRSSSAVLNGVVNPNGLNTDVTFEWGSSTAYGNVVVADQSPVDGAADVAVSASITGLNIRGTYHYRVVATNDQYTVSTRDLTFTTPEDQNTTTDINVVEGDGDVSFPGTNVTLGITFTSQIGQDTIEVSQITTDPGGTLPAQIGLVASIYWEIDHHGEGEFATITITLVVGSGTFSTEEQANPSSIKLLRRDDESVANWTVIASASSATESSATFEGITGFSQFTIGESLADTQAPSITSLAYPTQAVDLLTNVTVTTEVTDNVGIDQLLLYYGPGGTTSFTSTTMQATAQANQYSGTIPGSSVTVRGIVFYIWAADETGNADTSETRSVRVRFSKGDLTTNITSSAYSSGFPKDRWRLVSVPANPDNKSVSAIMGNELGSSGNTTWKIYGYTHNPDNQWQEVFNLEPGLSYWLYQQVGDNISFDAGAGSSNDMQSFTVTLQQGWNMISTPYPFRVSLPPELGTSDYYGPFTYSGSGDEVSGWQSVSQLAPWGGAIINNNSGSDQTITLSAIPPELSKDLLAKTSVIEPEGWLLDLAVVGSKYFDSLTTVGRLAGAADELDKFDSPEPPYIDGYVSLAMDRPDWSSETGIPRFASDIRSLDGTDGVWNLDLSVKDEQGPITLSREILGDLPPDYRIILLDVLTRKVYDLLMNDTPVIISDYREEFPYHLKLVAGTASYVSQTTEQILAELPAAFALEQNYPNPFNPSTTLRYSVTHPARVTLTVYNLLGQEIITLVDGWQDLGYYEVIWNGENQSGSPSASGVYFAVYTAEGIRVTRKMVLMK